jgi:hypothetical protein
MSGVKIIIRVIVLFLFILPWTAALGGEDNSTPENAQKIEIKIKGRLYYQTPDMDSGHHLLGETPGNFSLIDGNRYLLVLLQATDNQVDLIMHLKNVKALYAISFFSKEITDKTIEKLAGWKNLESLSLDGCTKITTEGMKHVATIPNLKELSLDGAG